MSEPSQSKLPVRVMIVDDEEPARNLICELVAEDRRFSVVGSSASGAEAISDFSRLKPDVLFLDIQMPKVDGFQVCKEIELNETKLVFITAHSEFALKAFDVQAFDYLTKPIRPIRFQRTLCRLASEVAGRRLLEKFADPNEPIHAEMPKSSEVSLRKQLNRQVLETTRGSVFFDPFAVEYLENCRNYIKVWISGECHLVRCTMKAILHQLALSHLVQVHRSYAVNLNEIQQLIRKRDGNVELLITSARIGIPVSRSHRSALERYVSERFHLSDARSLSPGENPSARRD